MPFCKLLLMLKSSHRKLDLIIAFATSILNFTVCIYFNITLLSKEDCFCMLFLFFAIVASKEAVYHPILRNFSIVALLSSRFSEDGIDSILLHILNVLQSGFPTCASRQLFLESHDIFRLNSFKSLFAFSRLTLHWDNACLLLPILIPAISFLHLSFLECPYPFPICQVSFCTFQDPLPFAQFAFQPSSISSSATYRPLFVFHIPNLIVSSL